MDSASLARKNNRRRDRLASLLSFVVPCVLIATVVGVMFFKHSLSELYRSHEMSGEHFTPTNKDYLELLEFSALFFVPAGLVSGIVGTAVYHSLRKRNKTT